MRKRIQMQSRRTDYGNWSEPRIVDLHVDSNIYGLLVLSEEEEKHSIPPDRVSIEYKDGQQHTYQLAGPCKECGRP